MGIHMPSRACAIMEIDTNKMGKKYL